MAQTTLTISIDEDLKNRAEMELGNNIAAAFSDFLRQHLSEKSSPLTPERKEAFYNHSDTIAAFEVTGLQKGR